MSKKEKDFEDKPARDALWIGGFTIAAITMIISGLLYTLGYVHDGNILWDGGSFKYITTWTYKIGGICLLALAAYGLRKKIYSESIFFITYAIFMTIVGFSYDSVALSDDAMRTIDLTLGIFLIIPALVMMLKKHIMISLAIIIYALGNILTEVISDPADCAVYGILAIVAGIMFAYVVVAMLVRTEIDYSLPIY